MKKRVFFQNSWYFFLLLSIVIIFVFFFIWALISAIFLKMPTELVIPKWLQIAIFALGVCLFGHQGIIFVRDRIVLDIDKIYVPESCDKTIAKAQYEVKLQYVDIADIFIVETQKDSLNLNDCSALPMPYIVIDCKNGDQKLINMYWYSKKRFKTILNEIILRARSAGNDFTNKTGEEIYNDFVFAKKELMQKMKEKRKNEKSRNKKNKK